MVTLSQSINEQKKELRTQAKMSLLNIIKNKQDLYQRQNSIIERIELSKAFSKAKNVLTYYPLYDEFDLSSMIISNPDKNWFLPRPIGDGIMLLFQVGELHELKEIKNNLKVPVATNKVIKAEDLDLVIVPGLGFDKNNYRLGRGGGYYDRLLKKLKPKAKSMGVIFEELMHEELPKESHDIALDEIMAA